MPSVLHGGRYLAVYTVSLSPSLQIGATPVFTCDAQIKTTININFSEPHEIDVEQIRDDSGLYQFLVNHVPQNASTDVEEFTYEDGTKTSVASMTNPLLLIVRGGLSGDARKIYTAIVQIDPTSGSYSQEGNKYNRPALKFKSGDPGVIVTVPTTYYNSIAVTPAQVTFGTGNLKYGRVTFA